MQAMIFKQASGALLALLLTGCMEQRAEFEPAEVASGGGTTIVAQDSNAFSLPSANLPVQRRLDFSVGNAFFRNPWVAAPATTAARDGLGPLFNTNTCQNCHIKDGRGHPPENPEDDAVSMLVRLSVPVPPEYSAMMPRMGVMPEPTYGGQLQDFAIPGVPAEGRVQLDYTEQTMTLADGVEVQLRKPQVRITELGYGPMSSEVMMSARVAPVMIGLGLLEVIPAEAILALADPDDQDSNGISGRPNQVWDSRTQSSQLGRFGWKAGKPTLEQQNAGAFAGDVGITSNLVSATECTERQPACLQQPHGGVPEVSDEILDFVTFYTRNLAVPARRNAEDKTVLRGKHLFSQLGCADCHQPSYVTATLPEPPALSEQRIWPYTDLLLHDMGEGLADQRPEFLASGREWRTPPLWGIGLVPLVNGHSYFLHDGRARNLLEAILWHGGEAAAAKDAVVALKTSDRDALIQFLQSL